MKNILLILIGICIFLVDLAALDDITTGNEPDYLGEYFVLAVSIPVFFVLAYVFKTIHSSKKSGKK